MHIIYTTRFLTEIICNQNKVGFFICILLILNLKVNNRVILHFYEEINYKEASFDIENGSSTCFSKFVKKKFHCYIHNECIECSQFILQNNFPLNFDNKNESALDDMIFINTKVLKFNDFLRFLNAIKGNSELKENFHLNDFLLVIRIINVFKFKKDRNFSQTIRTLLLSIILNSKFANVNYNLNPKTILSSSIYKIIFSEFCKIYFFDTNLLTETTSWIGIKESLNEKSGIDYKITKKFIFINSTLITVIDKHMKSNEGFLIIFRMIFEDLQIFRAILYGNDISCQNIQFHLPYILFSNIDELCFYSWKDMNFFNFMADNWIHKNVRILTFISCYFLSFSESFFDNLKSLQFIYFIDSYIADPISSCKLNTYLELFVHFYNDITNKINIASFLELASDRQHIFENIDTSLFFDINKSLITSQEFKSSEYQVFSFNEMSYMSHYYGLYVCVSNSQIIKRISVIFTEISLRGLAFQNPLIFNNIKELSIWDCEFSNIFLHDILLIPSLKKFVINNCKAFFEKPLKYEKQLYLTNLSVLGSTFENSDEMIKFLNCMPNLKNLDLCHNKNLDIFENISLNRSIALESLESLVLYDREKYKDDLPNISKLKILKSFKLCDGWYEEGSLFNLFINESLSDICDLSLDKFQIGIKDNGAMKRCSKIKELYFFYCEFINIAFSQLFDPKKTYIIEKLGVNKIVLTISDILFISNLFCLKYLDLYIKDFSIDTKDFFKIIFLNKSQLKIDIRVPEQYWRQMNYFKEGFKSSNHIIY